MKKEKFYPVGAIVTPKEEYNESVGRLYTSGRPYTVVRTDETWNYIHRDDGTGLIGVATFVLDLYHDQDHSMPDPEFSLDEIAQAKSLMESLP